MPPKLLLRMMPLVRILPQPIRILPPPPIRIKPRAFPTFSTSTRLHLRHGLPPSKPMAAPAPVRLKPVPFPRQPSAKTAPFPPAKAPRPLSSRTAPFPPKQTVPSPKAAQLPPPSPSSPPRPTAPAAEPPLWTVFELFCWLVSLVSVIFVGIPAFLFVVDIVNGSSMAPTLNPGFHERGERDRVFILRPFVSSFFLGRRKDGQGDGEGLVLRGDVVTFWKPHDPKGIAVKRVRAVAGDVVYPCRGYAVDGSKNASSRLGWSDGLIANENGSVTVPPNHVWVEGDNAAQSRDSCDYGPVSLELLDGIVVRVWRGWWWKEIDGLSPGVGVGSRVLEGQREEQREGSLGRQVGQMLGAGRVLGR